MKKTANGVHANCVLSQRETFVHTGILSLSASDEDSKTSSCTAFATMVGIFASVKPWPLKICMHMYTAIHMYVYIYVYMYVYIYIYICTLL